MVAALKKPDQSEAVRQAFLTEVFQDVALTMKTHLVWGQMSVPQRYICIRGLVSEVSTKEELERRLRADFDVQEYKLNWYMSVEHDDLIMEIKELHILRQGLFAQNGACVTLIIDNLVF